MIPSRARTTGILLIFLGTSPLFADWDDGVAAFNAGRYEDAAAQFRAVVSRSPEAPAGHYMLGMSLLRQQQTEESLEPLAKAVELDAADPLYRLGLAQAQLKADRPDDALPTLAAQEVAAVPDARWPAYGRLLAEAAIRSGRHAAARAALDKVAAALAKAAAELDETAEELGEAPEVDRSPKALWLTVAHVAREANRSQWTFSALAAAYELDPDDGELGLLTVETALAFAQKDSGDARKVWYGRGFEVARKWAAASKSAAAYDLAGQARMGEGDYGDARSWFAKAAAAHPGAVRPHYDQARCALALQEAEAALSHLRAALERSPDPELRRQILETQGWAWRHLEEFERAAESFRAAGNGDKVAEMERFREAQLNNRKWEQERRECRRKLAVIEQLKQEHANLEGTDDWARLEEDHAALLAACGSHPDS